MTYKIDLKPQYDSKKSYYGKAKVGLENGDKVLYSYGTKVARVKDGKAEVYGTYSQTTARHIKDFLQQEGFKAETSKQILKDYGSEKNKSSSDNGTFKQKTESSEPSISSLGDGKIFQINDKMKIITEYKKTRTGFRHNATLLVNGEEVDKSTAHYLNRTWESYEYQSVVDSLINKTSYISKEQKEPLKKKFQELATGKIKSEFETIGTIAMLGDVFGKTQKERIAWKERMIKAGMGKKGLSFPEDWEKLSDDTKEKRLDLIIKELRE